MLVLKLLQSHCLELIPVTITDKIADGADGEVFNFSEDPNKVIKLCVLYESSYEDIYSIYKRTTSVLDYLLKNPSQSFAQVYEHKYICEWGRTVEWKKDQQKYLIYYYIMEKLQKISEDEKRLFHSIISHEDRGIKKNFSMEKIKEILCGLKRGLDFDEKKVIFFLDNFKKTPINHNDLHVRNVMKDINGNFRLIDFDRTELRMENSNGKST
jgi:serine/threonine protein kinase